TAAAQKHSLNGMSAEIADADNDGLPLIFSANIYEPGRKIGGNVLWKALNPTRFLNRAWGRGVGNCGFAWGAKFVDLDNKGRQDLVVSNGYTTGNPGKDLFYSGFVLSQAAWEYSSRISESLAIAKGSWSGRQQDCVFYNRGRNFEDVSGPAGIDAELWDGRSVAVVDFLNNGHPGIVIANQAGPLKLYRNDPSPDNHNHWIGFKLRGTRSNRDAFGT